MTHYVVTVELDAPVTEAVADWLIETLHDQHAVAIGHDTGNIGAIMTLPADDLAQAAVTAHRLIEPTYPVVSLSVIDEVTRDRREGLSLS